MCSYKLIFMLFFNRRIIPRTAVTLIYRERAIGQPDATKIVGEAKGVLLFNESYSFCRSKKHQA